MIIKHIIRQKGLSAKGKNHAGKIGGGADKEDFFSG